MGWLCGMSYGIVVWDGGGGGGGVEWGMRWRYGSWWWVVVKKKMYGSRIHRISFINKFSDTK